jgi:serine/threonine protein kinase
MKSSYYKLDNVIGDGMFGLVWKAHCFDKTSKYHMQTVSIKILSFDKVSEHKTLEET